MGVTAFPQTENYPQGRVDITRSQQGDPDWRGMAVCGAFLAGALLLLNGRKKAGLLVTTAATALTLLDQQETLKDWWNAIPEYLDNADRLLGQAERTIDSLAAAGEKLRAVLNRQANS